MVESKPIIFNSKMVKAILDGRKTQTRRVIKTDFMISPEESYPYHIRGKYALWNSYKTLNELIAKHCPYGKQGDHLWVKETWNEEIPGSGKVHYRADEDDWPEKWRPSIFMPRRLSRILLRIVDIRVEKIQDITFDDVVAEGTPAFHGAMGVLSDNPPDRRWKFIELWDSINAKRGYSWESNPWESNPWVWAITFELLEEE